MLSTTTETETITNHIIINVVLLTLLLSVVSEESMRSKPYKTVSVVRFVCWFGLYWYQFLVVHNNPVCGYDNPILHVDDLTYRCASNYTVKYSRWPYKLTWLDVCLLPGYVSNYLTKYGRGFDNIAPYACSLFHRYAAKCLVKYNRMHDNLSQYAGSTPVRDAPNYLVKKGYTHAVTFWYVNTIVVVVAGVYTYLSALVYMFCCPYKWILPIQVVFEFIFRSDITLIRYALNFLVKFGRGGCGNITVYNDRCIHIYVLNYLVKYDRVYDKLIVYTRRAPNHLANYGFIPVVYSRLGDIRNVHSKGI